MNHAFDIDVATHYGINVAVFLENIAYWTKYHIALGTNFHDERYWIYDTHDAFSKLFPYFTKKQVRTIIQKCIDDDLIMISNYNKKAYDRTLWYSLTDKALSIYNIISTYPQQINKNNEISSEETCGIQADDTLLGRINTHMPKRANASAQKGTAIPNIEANIEFNNNSCAHSSNGTLKFESFWTLYPTKKAKKKCQEIWKRKKLDLLCNEIIEKLKAQITRDKQFLQGFIPNPSTYLNQERWEDEISPEKKIVIATSIKAVTSNTSLLDMAEQEKLSRLKGERMYEEFKSRPSAKR